MRIIFFFISKKNNFRKIIKRKFHTKMSSYDSGMWPGTVIVCALSISVSFNQRSNIYIHFFNIFIFDKLY